MKYSFPKNWCLMFSEKNFVNGSHLDRIRYLLFFLRMHVGRWIIQALSKYQDVSFERGLDISFELSWHFIQFRKDLLETFNVSIRLISLLILSIPANISGRNVTSSSSIICSISATTVWPISFLIFLGVSRTEIRFPTSWGTIWYDGPFAFWLQSRHATKQIDCSLLYLSHFYRHTHKMRLQLCQQQPHPQL